MTYDDQGSHNRSQNGQDDGRKTMNQNDYSGQSAPDGTHEDGPRGSRHHGWGWHRNRSRMGCGHRRSGWTGNSAFDQHQAEVLQALRVEREAFRAYQADARNKRDQELYEAFRASQAKQQEPGKDA